ncbi:aldo/keto reductase [Vibrio sp. VB16]|uniref:aldo/keto reductase n=1 Tax=Vibrio sp. VB16 TaxID=2785746 RepID=UPI0018A0143E|nr:aldo/keto reductase [Vibrio sp. VB16]UGA54968.1 aldo/keto reductase [Vibrio sp. VB16]
MKVVVGLQARTNSSRLPGKVLLPIGGMPLSVLAAKRAVNNKQFDLKVLTSEEATDDHLCHTLESHNVPYFRGSLNNVLDRFVKAFADYDDETIVVRLTADNVVPDAELITEVIQELIGSSLHYLCANGEASGLPYGMSVEVTYLSCLREANASTSEGFDQEHVTPYVRRKYGDRYLTTYADKQLGHLRCTVDSFDDYIHMSTLFDSIENPLDVSCWELVDRLKADFKGAGKAEKLVLGSVQLGLNYGINNDAGQPNIEQAHDMLSSAINLGVSYIDTARAYGESEAVIGKWLTQGWQGRQTVITKLDPLASINENTSEVLAQSLVENSVLRSCKNLKLDKLDVLMLHRTSHITAFNGVIFEKLKALKSEGYIEKLGASVQSAKELELALSNADISIIQLPFNILDYRWNDLIPLILQEKKKRDLIIHVRSVFLQGLLLTDKKELWAKACDNQTQIPDWLKRHVEETNSNNVHQLCIRYVLSQTWIDGLVLGSDNVEQVIENANMMALPALSVTQLASIDTSRPESINDKLLNPALWT